MASASKFRDPSVLSTNMGMYGRPSLTIPLPLHVLHNCADGTNMDDEVALQSGQSPFLQQNDSRIPEC